MNAWVKDRAVRMIRSMLGADVLISISDRPEGMMACESRGVGDSVFVGVRCDRSVEIQTRDPIDVGMIDVCVTHNGHPFYVNQLRELRDNIRAIKGARLVVDDEKVGTDWSIAAGRNRSIDKSTADHVLVVDCDSRITPSAWAAMVESYANGTHPIGGLEEYVLRSEYRRYLLSSRDEYRYDEDYQWTHCEDTDLYFDLSSRGYLLNCIAHEGFSVARHSRPSGKYYEKFMDDNRALLIGKRA